MLFFARNDPKDGMSAQRVDYPEALALIFTTALLLWNFGVIPLTLALTVMTAIPSIVLVVYNYSRSTNFSSSVLIVAMLAFVIGSVQLYPIISFGFIALIVIRILKEEVRARLYLMLAAIMIMGGLYAISTMLEPEGPGLGKGWWIYSILAISLVVIIWQYWQDRRQFVIDHEIAKSAQLRLTSMVTVISRLIRFLPPQVWKPIVRDNAEVSIRNKRAKLTVLFSDIAGFTQLSDSLSSDHLADILNTYMERMTAIAHHHGATLDKFIGDGAVCFFGEPNSKGGRQDALDCVAMAIDMRREMRTLRHQWRLLGFDGLYIRIGIATGYCHVGNFGSESRMSYTLIGREVNLAARLESAAQKDEILISENTYDYVCHEYDCIQTAPYQLKGFENPIRAWQVLDPDTSQDRPSKWVDHELPGFNLHLNLKEVRNYDYPIIKQHLSQVLAQLEKETTLDEQDSESEASK